jgi:hypothetical protein
MKCRLDWDLRIRASGEQPFLKVILIFLGGGEFLDWMLDNQFIKK